MTPTTDGHDIEVAFKNVTVDSVAQAGRVRENQICGGVLSAVSTTEIDVPKVLRYRGPDRAA